MDYLHSLNLQSFALGCILVWLLHIGWTIAYAIFFHPLNCIPGPLWARITRIPYWFHCLRGHEVYLMQRLHEKHGSVVRFSPVEVSFINGQAWKDICTHQKGKTENIKAPWFHMESPDGKGADFPSLIVNSTTDHPRIRRIFSPGFSDRALKQQQPLFQKYSSLLMTKLREKKGEPLDIHKMFNYTTFDIMGELTFGRSLGQLEGGQYSAWVQNIMLAVKALPTIQLIQYYPLLRICFDLLEPRKILESRVSQARYPAEQVDERMKRTSDQPDLWNLVESAGDGEGLSREEMHANARLFMLAGTETTGALLTALTYLLLTNTDKMQTLKEEVRTQARLTAGLSFQSLASMKYLNACINEALRLYPPVPIGIPRLLANDQLIGTTPLPKGTRVSVHHYAAYRSTTNFTNPEQFIPERWLSGYEDKRDVFQPFSYGPRNCLGQNMAWHEMRLIFGMLVAGFDMELCEESQAWLPGRVFVLWEKKPLMVKVRAVEG